MMEEQGDSPEQCKIIKKKLLRIFKKWEMIEEQCQIIKKKLIRIIRIHKKWEMIKNKQIKRPHTVLSTD